MNMEDLLGRPGGPGGPGGPGKPTPVSPCERQHWHIYVLFCTFSDQYSY